MEVSSYTFQNPYPQAVQVGRPSPEMVQAQQEKNQKQIEDGRKSAEESSISNPATKLGEIAVKSSAAYQKDNSYSDTRQSVKAYMDFAKDARRPEQIQAYISNSGAGSINNDV